MQQGQGSRCYGYLSSDGDYAHCTREEHAGTIPQTLASQTYAHRLAGECRCGTRHGDATPVAPPYPTPRPDVVNTTDYEYRDPAGGLVAIHRRTDYSDGSKNMPWLTPAGQLSAGAVKPEQLPLYRLPELLDSEGARPIYLVEGEKACDALREIGFVAVTLAGGAGQKNYGTALDALTGHTVILCADNDDQGRTHMNRLAAALAGVAASIQRHTWPDAPQKGDAADFVEAGGTAAQWEAFPQEDAQATTALTVPHRAPVAAFAPAWPEPPGPAAFTGLAGRIVDAFDPHTEADRSAVLLSLLTAFGCAVGTGPHFMVGATRHPARINAAIAGNSSKARKGDSWNPIRLLLADSGDSFSKRIASGLSTGEGLIWQVRDEVTQTEAVKEHGKPTGKFQSVITDAGEPDKRLLVVETELARVFTVMAREGNTLSAIMRDAFDSGNVRSMTKASPMRATEAHISMLAHITLDELRHKLPSGEMANGWANRIIFGAVRRSKLLPEPEPPPDDVIDELQVVLARALDQARTVGRIRRDADASALWCSIYEDLSAERDGIIGALTARAEALVLRLSMIYALLDGSEVITQAHLLAAAEVWAYSERSVAYIFQDTTGDAVADEIYRALLSSDGLSRTKISDLFQRNTPSKRIAQALTLLETNGRAVMSRRPSEGGRPVELWTPA